MKLLTCIIVAILPVVSAFQIQSITTFTGRKSCVRNYSRAKPKVFSFVNADEGAPRDIQSMEEWAAASGAQRAEGFQLTADDFDTLENVSVMTSQDLPADTPVLFVPNQMIISSNQAAEEFGRIEAAEKTINSWNASNQLPYFYLILKILVEYEKGEQSPWYPWLNSLPRYFSNGASMTSFCYQCLPPLVRSLAMKERNNFLALDVKQVPFLSEETKNNEALCKWAFQIAYTRSFEANDGSGDLRVAPLADMFNHGAEPEIAISYDEEGNCYAQTTRDIPAGSPLRMSYGDPTNPSYLLARYGFVDDSSPATFCKIMIPHENSQLQDMGYAYNRMLFYKDTGEVSEEVWDVLLYQILSSSNASRRREFYEAHMKGDYETKQSFHEHYYPETSAKLQAHVDDFIKQLDELSAKANLEDPKKHPRIPLILKHNEFVKNTFLAVKARYFENVLV